MIADIAIGCEDIVLGRYLFEGDDAGNIFLVGIVEVVLVDGLHVFGREFVLRAADGEYLRSIDHEDTFGVRIGFDAPEYEDTRGETCSEEEFFSEGDDGFEHVGLDHLLAHLTFFVTAEEDALRHDNRHATSAGFHRLDHVLYPSEVGSDLIAGCAPDVTAVLIVSPFGLTPTLEGEWRIGDDAVEACDCAALEDLGFAEGVALEDIEITGTVEEEVHLRDSGVGDVLPQFTPLTTK